MAFLKVSGRTSFDAGHTHSFEVTIDTETKRVIGKTSFDGGHLHQIDTTQNGALETQTANGHIHTFSVGIWQGPIMRRIRSLME